MIDIKDIEFRQNSYLKENIVFVCNTKSSLDMPREWDWHRDIIWEFGLEFDEDINDFSREELLRKWMNSLVSKLEREKRNLEFKINDLNKEIKQLERGYYVPDNEDELE